MCVCVCVCVGVRERVGVCVCECVGVCEWLSVTPMSGEDTARCSLHKLVKLEL